MYTLPLSPVWRRSRHRGGYSVFCWICVVWYPGGRGSNVVAGAHTRGIQNGTFQFGLIFINVAAKQREHFTALSSVAAKPALWRFPCSNNLYCFCGSKAFNKVVSLRTYLPFDEFCLSVYC